MATEAIPIFVLHSYSQEYPWTKGQHQGFIETLHSDTSRTYSFNVEYLDTKRSRYNMDYADLIARYLREKYKDYQPAAVYVTDDNALTFALAKMDKLFPDVPVFFSGVNNFDIKSQLDPAHITGVFEKKEISPNLRLMQRIDANVKDIVIVGDTSETYNMITNEVRNELSRYPDFHVTFLSDKRIDSLVRRLKKHTEHYIFLTTLGAIKDADGRTQPLAETINTIVHSGRFVVFSMEDAYLYPGVLGGFVTSGPRQGQVAAQLLQNYLNGTSMTELPPVEDSPNEYILNEAELQKAGLSLSNDLPGEVKLIKPLPGFYATHRNVILATLYGLIGLVVLILAGSLVLFIRKNREIAQSSRQILAAKEGLIHAQRIAQMGNWDWQITENRLYWSEGIYRLFGIEPDEFDATYEAFLNYVHEDDRAAVEEAVKLALESGAPYDIDHRLIRPDGEIRYVHESAEVHHDSEGRPTRMIGTVQDITEHKRAERALREKDAHLEHIAYHDILTGLPNRALLFDRLVHASSRADRNGNQIALMFIDLDRFKTINDSLGHAVGDALLQQAATRLQQLIRASDTVSRLGGDEFMILLEDLDDGKKAAIVAEKIIRALAQPFGFEGHQLYVSSSIGISLYPQDGCDAETLMKNADAAMYRVKDSGRNNFHFYEREITEHVLRRLQIESRLRMAVEQNALELFYQPVVCLEDRRICGVEALLRWHDPDVGTITPDQFVPLAEETGLIIPLGEWVIRQACTALKQWKEQGLKLDDFAMHINLSGRQLRQKALPQRIQDIFIETGVPPECIVLELTESTIMESKVDGQDILIALCEVGISIAIDDFGTGHSSLSRLKQLPIRELKIDRSFIQDITVDANDSAIVQAILAMAVSLDLCVVAEGVETIEQESFLIQNGSNMAQGYYYARPMPEAEIRPLLLDDHTLPEQVKTDTIVPLQKR